MLRVLGYDPNANPPNYGKPDEIVIQKTQDVHKNVKKWNNIAAKIVNASSLVNLP